MLTGAVIGEVRRIRVRLISGAVENATHKGMI